MEDGREKATFDIDKGNVWFLEFVHVFIDKESFISHFAVGSLHFGMDACG